MPPHLLRSHVWLYTGIIVSRSYGNTSLYVDTVINFAKVQHTTCIHTFYILRTYYVQNKWPLSLFLNSVQARQKIICIHCLFVCFFFLHHGINHIFWLFLYRKFPFSKHHPLKNVNATPCLHLRINRILILRNIILTLWFSFSVFNFDHSSEIWVRPHLKCKIRFICNNYLLIYPPPIQMCLTIRDPTGVVIWA